MSLPHGGHLTHGSKVSFSGTWFTPVSYTVRRDTELIDYDEVRDLALAHRPKMIIAGATAYPRLIDFARFREIADEVGAWLMVDAAHFIGLVAGGAIPSPVPYADVVTFTTHKVLRGPRGGMIVCRPELAARIDKAVFPFLQGGPLMHAVAAKAVALGECLQPAYRTYAHQVVANAKALAEGLAAEGMRPVSGGTDTHLALLDLRTAGVEGLTGAVAETRCDAARITLNKNAIPYDPEKPMVGVRHPGRHGSGHHAGHVGAVDEGGRRADRARGARLRRVGDCRGRRGGPVPRRRPPGVPDAGVADGGDVREYLLTLVVAATVTYLLTPVARRIALRWGAMTPVRDRDVHAIPTPRLGGIAMLGGFGAGLLVATQMPFLGPRLGDGQQTARAAGRRRADLPARRRRRQVGAGRPHQARGTGARGGCHGHRRRADALPADRRPRR